MLSQASREELEGLVYQNKLLPGVAFAKSSFQLSLKEAIEFLQWLEPHLRAKNPHAFMKPADQFWKGFYS